MLVPRYVDPVEAEAQMLAVGLQALEPYPGNNKPWRCLCLTCRREVTPTRANVYTRGRGCKFCAPNAPVDPDRARETMRAAFLEPLEPFKSAHALWRCQCLHCGATVTPRLSNIQTGFSGCLPCANRRIALAQLGDPDKANADMLAAHLRPLVPYPGVNKPWRCECLRCGDEVRPALGRIRQGNGGCRRCGRARTTLKQLGDPEKAAAEMLAAQLRPLVSSPEVNKPWRCECLRCGDEVRPTLSSIRLRQSGCRRCGYASTGAKLRENPAKAAADMEAAGYTPLEKYPGAAALPWRCIHHPCGREVTARLASVRQGHGCRAACASYGFDTAAPAVVYVLHDPTLGVVKVGITAATSDRVARFVKMGFTVVGTLPFGAGQHARNVEQQVLRHVRTQLGLTHALTGADTGSIGGWTETFSATDLPPLKLWELVTDAGGSMANAGQPRDQARTPSDSLDGKRT
ncbi:hypothetical protein [Streptacidiphilus rugosus]|uniref:hypothetical protein n=1 Tax=Streptacidiphilus rugosus TaxID=405783 RepID=UPI00068C1AC1|nr:hypothetical protein [Streptacidiphilus rugosus]